MSPIKKEVPLEECFSKDISPAMKQLNFSESVENGLKCPRDDKGGPGRQSNLVSVNDLFLRFLRKTQRGKIRKHFVENKLVYARESHFI